MKESLLRSQFEDLEEPAYALTLDAVQAPDAIIRRIREVFSIP